MIFIKKDENVLLRSRYNQDIHTNANKKCRKGKIKLPDSHSILHLEGKPLSLEDTLLAHMKVTQYVMPLRKTKQGNLRHFVVQQIHHHYF